MKPIYTIGIDEVGRGPLAGPVAVGAFVIKGKLPVQFKKVRDSKQLTALGRAIWFEKIKLMQRDKNSRINFAVSFVNARLIDKNGISWAIKTALKRSLKKLNIDPAKSLVLLDGGLKAPQEFKNQKTIIKGDEKESVIALASIVAKVLRDRKMEKLSRMYPEYDFHVHKGYGTKAHVAKIRKYGASSIHRKSFLHNI